MIFMAASVAIGHLTMEYLSQVDCFFTDFFRAMGLRAVARVLGSLKVVLFQIFCFLAVCAPFLTAEAACFALYTNANANKGLVIHDQETRRSQYLPV